MIRIGMYATYNGKEYKAARLNSELYKLIDDDGSEPLAGFVRSEFAPQAYVKNVPVNDLTDIYIVKTYADFQGERFEVVDVHNEIVTIAISDARVAQRLGLDKIDRYDYRLKVGKGEVLRFVEELDRLG